MKSKSQDSPYVGLVPYSEKDAARFCGRDKETGTLVSLTLGRRCLVVHGPSGVGKSSLLRAGVTASLHEIAAAQQEAFGKPDFVVAYCSNWKDPDPLHSVKAAIAGAWSTALTSAGNLRDTVAAGVQEKGTDLVLILDQFEEFFLYHPDAISRPETAARGWLGQIASLMSSAPASGKSERTTALPVHLVITLREEALAKLDGLQRLLPTLFDNVYRVAPLTTAQAREAVIAPLQWWNKSHPSEPPVTATPAFADQVAAEVRHGHVEFEELSQAQQSTTGFSDTLDAVEAPFLQLVLETVWQESNKRWSQCPELKRELGVPILTELGGAPSIVNNHLKSTLEQSKDSAGRAIFRPGELKLIARLSLHLVTVDLAKIAHSAASLAGFVERSVDEIEDVLTKLERLRILRRISVLGTSDQDRFEISHDMLGKAIVNWRPTYLRKVEVSRVKEEVKQTTIKWSLVAAVIGFTILGILLFFAIKAQKESAEAAYKEMVARKAAEMQRMIAEDESAEAKRLQEEAKKELEAARDSAKRDIQNRSREETEKRLAQENKLREITDLIDDFLKKYPAYQNDLRAASTGISQSLVQLQNPRIASLNPDGPVGAARYSPDDKYIAVGSENKNLYLWSRSGGDPLAQTVASSSKGGVKSLAFSPAQGFLLTGSAGGSIRLFDPRRSELGKGLDVAAQNSVNFIGFSKDGRYSVSLDDDRLAMLRDWDLYPKVLPTKPAAIWKHYDAVSFAHFSSDGSRVVTSSDDGMVRVYETSGGGSLLAVNVNGSSNNPLDVKAPTRKFHFSPTNPALVVGGAGYSKLVWFYLSGNRKALYQHHAKGEAERGPFIHGNRGAVWDVSFSPNGVHLASVGTDGLCLIWDTSTAKTIASIPSEIGGRLLDVEWSDKDLLALAGEDGWIELWDLGTPSEPKKVFAIQAHTCPVWSIQFDPLREQMLTYGRDLRPIVETITPPSGRAAEWKAPPTFPSADPTAAIWDIEAARRKGWSSHARADR
jgi:WD40 repeat protein